MLIAISGLRNGKRWPAIGQVLECSKREGEKLIGNGYAEAVKPSVKAVRKTTKKGATAAVEAPEKR